MINIATVYVRKVKKGDFESFKEYKEKSAENLDSALKLLKKKISQEGTLKEYRERMYYVSPGDKKRKAKKAGRRKQLKKMYKERRYFKD